MPRISIPVAIKAGNLKGPNLGHESTEEHRDTNLPELAEPVYGKARGGILADNKLPPVVVFRSPRKTNPRP